MNTLKNKQIENQINYTTKSRGFTKLYDEYYRLHADLKIINASELFLLCRIDALSNSKDCIACNKSLAKLLYTTENTIAKTLSKLKKLNLINIIYNKNLRQISVNYDMILELLALPTGNTALPTGNTSLPTSNTVLPTGNDVVCQEVSEQEEKVAVFSTLIETKEETKEKNKTRLQKDDEFCEQLVSHFSPSSPSLSSLDNCYNKYCKREDKNLNKKVEGFISELKKQLNCNDEELEDVYKFFNEYDLSQLDNKIKCYFFGVVTKYKDYIEKKKTNKVSEDKLGTEEDMDKIVEFVSLYLNKNETCEEIEKIVLSKINKVNNIITDNYIDFSDALNLLKNWYYDVNNMYKAKELELNAIVNFSMTERICKAYLKPLPQTWEEVNPQPKVEYESMRNEDGTIKPRYKHVFEGIKPIDLEEEIEDTIEDKVQKENKIVENKLVFQEFNQLIKDYAEFNEITYLSFEEQKKQYVLSLGIEDDDDDE